MEFRYSILTCIIWSFLALNSLAQTAKDVSVMEIGTSLPYYEGFVLTYYSKDIDNFENTDSCILTIRRKGDSITSVTGMKTDTSFRFGVPALLPSKAYELSFDFYSSGDLPDDLALQLTWSIINPLIDTIQKKEFLRSSEVARYSKLMANEFIGQKRGDLEIEGLEFEFTDAMKKRLLVMPARRIAEEKHLKEVNVLRTEITETFEPEKSDRILTFIDKERPVSKETKEALALPDKDSILLNDIESELDSYKAQRLVNKNDSIFIENSIKDLIVDGTIRYNYTREFQTSISKETSNYPESFRFGLKYGIGLVGFKKEKGLHTDFTQYILVRFYLGKSDKTKEYNYGWNWNQIANRISINFGAGLSDLQYDSRDVEVTNSGMRLMTGIGFDLHKHFSIEMGVYFFNITEGNPFKINHAMHAAPYIGVSFDANIIEFLTTR